MQLNNFVNFINSFNIMEIGLKINSILVCITSVFNIIEYIYHIYKPNNVKIEEKENNNSTSKLNITYIIGTILTSTINIILMYFILKYTNYQLLQIPIYMVLIYALIINPILDGNLLFSEKSKFIVTIYIFCILSIIHKNTFKVINWFYNIQLNNNIFQAIIIIYFFIELYLMLYCLFINIYFINKVLICILDKPIKLFMKVLKKIDTKLGYSDLTLEFENYKKFKLKKNYLTKSLSYIFYLLFDVIKNSIYYSISIFYSLILSPILVICKIILLNIVNITNYDSEKLIYTVTKLILMLTFIIEFISIQLSGLFADSIITIYEYLSTAIMIPLILDSIQSFKK